MVVIVIDVCSSSTILERIKQQDSFDLLGDFYQEISNWITKYIQIKIDIYKFIGDGFILISDVPIDEALIFCNKLTIYINNLLETTLLSILEDPVLPRRGITIGLDVGDLYITKISNKEEYLSRCINIASRLQGTLKDKYEVNRIALSSNAYYRIKSTYTKNCCALRKNNFRNISDEKEIIYYEYFTDLALPKVKLNQNISKSIFNNPTVTEFRYKLVDSSGTVVFISKGFMNLNEAYKDKIDEEIERQKSEQLF